jgi:uncharacterized membrane protein HdeD (DUF308 family)
MNARDLSPFGGMIGTLTKKWWIFLVQGILMILLAILAFSQPALLISAIGAYVAIDGAVKLFSAFGGQTSDQSRWLALFIGALGIILGLVIWFNPGLAAQVVTYLVAAWAVVVGLLLVLWGWRFREAISTEWLFIALGILSIAFGFIVFGNVEAGFATLQLIFGIYMIVGGIVAIVLSFQVRSLGVRLGAVG